VDIATAKGEVTVRLDPEHRLTAREREVLEALYVPSRRQARQGAKAALPRIVFREQQICLGYNKRDPQALIPVLDDLLQRLADRRHAAADERKVTEKEIAAKASND